MTQDVSNLFSHFNSPIFTFHIINNRTCCPISQTTVFFLIFIIHKNNKNTLLYMLTVYLSGFKTFYSGLDYKLDFCQLENITIQA